MVERAEGPVVDKANVRQRWKSEVARVYSIGSDECVV